MIARNDRAVEASEENQVNRCFTVTMFLLVWCGTASATEHLPYLPLAKITIVASGGKANTLVTAIADFARTEGLTIERSDIPKQGRWVVNESIKLHGDSMFDVSNFLKADEFEIIAYSHEEPFAWKPQWDRLVSRLSAQFPSKSR
jgi:hypothetical protein